MNTDCKPRKKIFFRPHCIALLGSSLEWLGVLVSTITCNMHTVDVLFALHESDKVLINFRIDIIQSNKFSAPYYEYGPRVFLPRLVYLTSDNFCHLSLLRKFVFWTKSLMTMLHHISLTHAHTIES